MTTAQSAKAYQQFTKALAAWWATPGRHALRKPELADFDGTDPLDESPQSERAAKPTKKPATK
jgi:hypothetical protein